MTPVDQARITESITDTQRALSELAPGIVLANDELKGLSHTLGQKLEAARTRLDQVRLQSRRLEEITTAVAYSPAAPRDNLGQLAVRLQEYIKAYPEEPRSLAFKEVLNDQPLWNAVDAWNRLAAEWKVDRDGLSPADARDRAALVRPLPGPALRFPRLGRDRSPPEIRRGHRPTKLRSGQPRRKASAVVFGHPRRSNLDDHRQTQETQRESRNI